MSPFHPFLFTRSFGRQISVVSACCDFTPPKGGFCFACVARHKNAEKENPLIILANGRMGGGVT